MAQQETSPDTTDVTTNTDTQNPSTDTADDYAQLSYEEASTLLVETVRTLERGGLSLEDSISLWERGERLGARCEELLTNASARIDALLEDNASKTEQEATPQDRQ